MRHVGVVGRIALIATVLGSGGAYGQSDPAIPLGPDAAPWLKDVRPATLSTVTKKSLYLTMKDGVRLAIDVYLPAGMDGQKLPTILRQTRYYRSSAKQPDPVASCGAIDEFHNYFGKRGYALIDVDVRGTGASFGTRSNEFSNIEVADGATIADWIVAQPWSNGKIGTTGVSYVGTTAEFALRNHHPAIVAAAPVSAGYDFYGEITRPGGIANAFFSNGWGQVIAALDMGTIGTIPGYSAVLGPCPVDEDKDGAMLKAAQAGHAANIRVDQALAGLTFRDNAYRLSIDGPSEAYLVRQAIDTSGVPVLDLEGWYDAGYGLGGVDRGNNTRNPHYRSIIMSGSHGLGYFYAPGVTAPVKSSFDVKGQLLQFFDHYVAGRPNAYDSAPRLRWFTSGSDIWRSAASWPRTSPLTYVLAPGKLQDAGRMAAPTRLAVAGGDAQSGGSTRWNTSLGGGAVTYAERSKVDAGLTKFTSAPLKAALTVTGSPRLTLTLTTATPETAVLVYLEEVRPDGKAYYITEGMRRLSHAKPSPQPYRSAVVLGSDLRMDSQGEVAGRPIDMTIGLLPFSRHFAAGTRFRLSFPTTDVAHFTIPADAGWALMTGGANPSSLTLPVETGR